MSRLGLLEGNGLRFKFGAAMVDPAAYEGAAMSREFSTTDWFSPAVTEAQYEAANQKWLDPEAWPTLALFRSAHPSLAPAGFLPDPGVVNTNVSAVVPDTHALQNPPAYSDAEYRAQAIANEAEAHRLATLPRDTVTGPSFLPDTSNAATVTPVSPSQPSYALPLLAAALAFLALKG